MFGRRWAPLIMALLLAACSRDGGRAPFTDSRIPPGIGPAGWPPPSWAWGLIRIGRDPAARYGVGAPRTPPRGQILFLPGYGEPVEADFPLIDALIRRGYDVWALEGVGQSGSGRIVEPRDLGYVESFATDVGTVRALSAQVIRPNGATFIIIANGSAATVALRALQTGLPSVTALILIEPRLTQPLVETKLCQAGRALGLGGLRAPWGLPWRRAKPAAAASPLDRAIFAWQAANPDLRMGAASLVWLAAFADLTGEVNAAGFTSVTVPVRILSNERGKDAADGRICRSLAHCERQGDTPDGIVRVVESFGSVQPTGEF